MALDYAPEQEFLAKVYGTIGEFASPAGPVAFLLTKARLGAVGADTERRFTEYIVPFREVIPARDLTFGQLLQRDIDDHRVAHDLIPYVLKASSGPAIFPPILTVILPFAGPDPVTSFPERTSIARYVDQGLTWQGWRRGDAYQIECLVTPQGTSYPMAVGRVQWNPEHAKVVVLDGQHRAMAMLAIQRTVTRSWDVGAGTRFKFFYEQSVTRLLDELRGERIEIDLERLHIPVAVCWFPDDHADLTPHQAARKLFVDVNKEARPPSPSRLTLLSETELLAIFARSLLERLRSNGEDDNLPLAAIEFDNPEADAARPVKWSVITNLEFIKHAIRRTVFGPPELVQRADTTISRGRMPAESMDRFMREQLAISTFLPAEFEDGDRRFEREQIGNHHFPRGRLNDLNQAFADSWGAAIIRVLSDLEPYSAHRRALVALQADWRPDDAPGRLAYDAIFEGVGVYWTLRSSYDAWTSLGRPPERRTEVVDAWNMLDARRSQFEGLRAEGYLGATDAAALEMAAKLYRTFLTNACQLGAVLALASLANASRVPRDGVPEFARVVISGWNASLAVQDRRCVLDVDGEAPLNQIRQMNTAAAVYFRYFWLEVLATEQGLAPLSGDQTEQVMALRDQGRKMYMELLEKQETQALRRVEPELSTTQLAERARESVRRSMKAALERWLDGAAEFDSWWDGEIGSASSEEADEEADGDDDADMGEVGQ